MAADLFETYAVTAVAVMLLASTHVPGRAASRCYPLALGGISILASVIGTFFARVGRARRDHQRALQGRARRDGPLGARLHPGDAGVRRRARSASANLYGAALVGLVVTFLLVAITEYYTGTRWGPVKSISAAVADGPRDEHHRGARRRHAGDGRAGDRDRRGHPASRKSRSPGLFGIGVAVMAQLSMTGLIVALDAYGPVTDNAGGIAEMADLRRVGARDHRPARRRRQHDEGRDEGLRDRLRRARRARPLRLLHARPRRRGAHHDASPLATRG